MSFPISNRPQTGTLNPAVLAANLPPSARPATAPLPSEQAGRSENLGRAESKNAGKNVRQQPQASVQPVSVAFPSQTAARTAAPGFQPVMAETDVNSVSRLYEALASQSRQGSRVSTEDEALLKKFGIGVDRQNQRLVSLNSGRVLAPGDVQVLQQAAKMRVASLSNQSDSVNQNFTQQLGVSSASLDELVQSYQNPDRQMKGMAIMLETSQNVMNATVDQARQLHGVSGFMANAAQATEGFNAALVSILRGEGVGELDLRQGANFIFAQLLTENDNAKLAGTIELLSTKSLPGQIASISDAEASQLKQLGIFVDKKNDRLVNLVTGEPMSSGQIQAIQQAAAVRQSMITGTSFMPGIQLDNFSRQAANTIQDAVGNLAELNTLRASLDQRAVSIGKLTQQVHDSHNTVRNDTIAIEDLRNRIDVRTQGQTTVSTLAGHLSANTANAFVLAQAEAGKLGELNQSLTGSGLSLGVDTQGQVTYSVEQRPVTQRDFLVRVTEHLAHTQIELSKERDELLALHSERARHIQESEEATAELDAATAAQRQDLERYEQESEQLRSRSLPELRALKADPAFWNSQSEQTRRMIEALIAQGDQALSQVDATLTRHRQIIREAESTVSESRSFISRARQASLATDRFIERLNAMLEAAEKSESGPSDESNQKLQELIAEAERLFAELTLAAQPGQTQNESLTQEMLITLEKLSLELRSGQREQVSRESFQDQIQQAYLEKTLENLNYHLDKLKALGSHQTQQLNQALQQAGQQLLPDLRQLR